MRVFVTGVSGFVGPVVARVLADGGHEVHGLVRSIDKGRARLTGLPVSLHTGDLRDPASLERALSAVDPEGIVHLAGFASVSDAERDPAAAYETNVGATLGLLGAMRAKAPGARLLAAMSGDIYGQVDPMHLPIDEDTPARPLTVYGASKAAADVAAAQWGRAYGLDVIRARPFNHTGPGQDAGYVCSAIARQLASIELGRQDPVVRVGNVDPVRDFSDVRDIAAGYLALLEGGRRGEAYNLCSGDGVSIAEVIALLRTHTRVPVRVHSDPSLRRANDIPRIVGSHARATADTGWRPSIPLTDTLAALLDDWRTRLASAR